MYTGEKFEPGLAFFADALGRITRFSREPADLAKARRLPGQAALPGLVNAHSRTVLRLFRGRDEWSGRSGATPDALARLTPELVYEAARVALLEQLLSGVTCVGEFLLPSIGGASSVACAEQVLRAAHEVGVRIGVFAVASAEAEHATADGWLRRAEALRALAGRYAADEAWVGAGVANVGTLPLDTLKAIGGHAHAQRWRLHAGVDATADAWNFGRLAEAGVLDKRLTLLGGATLTDEHCRALGAARASVCVSPSAELGAGPGGTPVTELLAAGAGLALGTAHATQSDVLKEARLLELALRARLGRRPVLAADPARALFHAATVAGARSLGATGGALEVGRPADFFTVNVFDPALAGADPESLLSSIVFALDRKAIREVWVGARQQVVGGRHASQGLIVGRFVEAKQGRSGSGSGSGAP